MHNRDKFILYSSIAVEIIAVGVGMVISPSWGYLLIVIGSIYFLYALLRMFRGKKPLSHLEMQHEIKKRKQYLPKLKDVITQRLSKSCELVQIAGEYPLIEYHNRYLNGTKIYARGKRFYPNDENMAILFALGSSGFITDNLYYDMLKENNADFNNLQMRYKMLYSRIKDKKLKRLLKQLWITEHVSNSDSIYPAFPISNWGHRQALMVK